MRAERRPFEELVEEHGALVLRVCRALLGEADAGDAWSETFLSALRAYPRLAPASDVRAWLVTIAHRKALDQLRRTTRRPRASELRDVEAPVDGAAPGLDVDLAAALAALPWKQRGAVVQRYLAGSSYAEIGRALGSNASAARRSAADGIASLRRHLLRRKKR